MSGAKKRVGEKKRGAERHQKKRHLTDGKHREKWRSLVRCAPDNVVVENNSLSNCTPATCKAGFDVTGSGGGGLGGGMVGSVGGAGLGAIISEIFGGDKDSENAESQPNVGANLSDSDKAEIGGAGSGTPGGWGPEDEEKGRNEAQTSGKNKDDQIWTETRKDDSVSNAYGHWDKHKAEFPEFKAIR